MGFLRRIFSSDYRRALAAEASGNYLLAAQCYALCGDRDKVAQMHLAQAGLEESLTRKIKALQTAASFAGPTTQIFKTISLQLGDALGQRSHALGLRNADGRQALTEAAARYEEGGWYERSATCWLQLGDRTRAAKALGEGGMLERMEQVLAEEQLQWSLKRRVEAAFQDYQALLAGGQRGAAAAALRRCIEGAERKGDYRRLLADLEQRLLCRNQVALQAKGHKLTLIGQFPLLAGRGADCAIQLRGHTVSRRHLRISQQPGALQLEDLGSHNGTTLNGLPLGGAVPLPQEGSIGLGESCSLAFHCEPEQGRITLTAERGLDQGHTFAAASTPLELDPLLPEQVRLTIAFRDGTPLASCPGKLLLNGQRVSSAELIRGDQIQVDALELKVLD